jgi:hypothetical protein
VRGRMRPGCSLLQIEVDALLPPCPHLPSCPTSLHRLCYCFPPPPPQVSTSGSVVVEKLMEVERYSHVMHISSTVTGRLDPALDAWDALRAALPAGTVSGAPKVRGCERGKGGGGGGGGGERGEGGEAAAYPAACCLSTLAHMAPKSHTT